MPKQINLGKVRGSDATINNVTAATLEGTGSIMTVTQSGTTIAVQSPAYTDHGNATNNPHGVTASQVGLGNVDNKSEATIIADAKTNIMTTANIEEALGYTVVSPTEANGVQNKLTGNPGQLVGFDYDGNAIAQDNIDPIYGFEIVIGETNPSSKIRYIGANAGFTPAHMDTTNNVFDYGDWANAWFIKNIKARIMASDGSIVEELDPTNYTLKADGTASSIADDTIDGNVMIGIPTVWIKIDTSVSTRTRITLASYKVDNEYHAWAHTDASGNILEYAYIAAYNGWDQFVDGTTAHKMRSISGKNPTRSQTGTNQIAYCRANNGTGSTIWDMSVLADRELIQMLCLLIGKSTNTQAVFGNGNMNGDSAHATAANIHAAIPGYPETGLGSDENGVLPTGTMDTAGLFWGSSAGNLGVKVFGIENFWGNIWDRTQGLVSVNGVIKAKLTRGMHDGTTVSDYNTTGDGYITIGVPEGGSDGAQHQNNYYEGYISEMKANQYGLFMGNLSGASATTGYCDYGWNMKTGTRFAIFGGICAYGTLDGPFYCHMGVVVSAFDWHIGARLSLK